MARMKTRYWLIVVGAAFIALPVVHHLSPAQDPHGFLAYYPLPIASYWEQLGAFWGSIVMLTVGCLLLYSGFTSKNHSD